MHLEAAAETWGIPRSTLNAYEKGTTTIPAALLIRKAREFGASLDILLTSPPAFTDPAVIALRQQVGRLMRMLE